MLSLPERFFDQNPSISAPLCKAFLVILVSHLIPENLVSYYFFKCLFNFHCPISSYILSLCRLVFNHCFKSSITTLVPNLFPISRALCHSRILISGCVKNMHYTATPPYSLQMRLTSTFGFEI